MTRMFACQTQDLSFVCDKCYGGQEPVDAERYGDFYCDKCHHKVKEGEKYHVIGTPKLYFVLVDDLPLKKAEDVVAVITREMGLKVWEYSELEADELEKFKDHKREILYEATNEEVYA